MKLLYSSDRSIRVELIWISESIFASFIFVLLYCMEVNINSTTAAWLVFIYLMLRLIIDRKYYPLNSISLQMMFCLILFLFHGIAFLFNQQYSMSYGGNNTNITFTKYIYILGIFLSASNFGWAVAFIINKKTFINKIKTIKISKYGLLRPSLFLIYIIIALYFSVSSISSLSSGETYGERFIFRQPVYSANHIILYVFFCLAAINILFAQNKKQCISTFIIWGIYSIFKLTSGGRSPVYIGGVALLWVSYNRFKFPNKYIIYLLLVLGFLIAPLIGVFRQISIAEWRKMPREFVINSISENLLFWSDSSFTVIETSRMMNDEKIDLWMGKSYYKRLPILIPNLTGVPRLGRNIDESPGSWFISKVSYEKFKRGEGFGYSPVAEALLNFGELGIVFVPFVLGFMIYIVEKIILNMSYNLSWFLSLGCAMNIMYYPRNEFYSFLKPAIWGGALSWLLVWILSELLSSRFHTLNNTFDDRRL